MVKPIVYRNTATNLPNHSPIHPMFPRGYAYETDTHFVHFYGQREPTLTVTCGLTVTQAKNGTLREWCERAFGAVEIEEGLCDVGVIENSLWRPGLLADHEVQAFLSASDVERRLFEQALLSLLQRLEEIYIYIEPTPSNLLVYGHRIRELHIIACTEVENILVAFLRLCNLTPQRGRVTMNQYVLIKDISTVSFWNISFMRYDSIRPFSPFETWESSNPTTSLPWYDAYNKTKHDRTANFRFATLEHAIDAVFACLVLYVSRYGPYKLWDATSSLSSIVMETYKIELRDFDPKRVYIPDIDLPVNQTSRIVCYNSIEQLKPRKVVP